jgi:very-short-patch-repair endonuclease
MKKWGIQRRPPSQAFKGKRRSEEFKKKLRMKLKGRKKTAEQRKKISETLKLRYKNGEIKPWSKGLTKNNDKRLAEIARKVSLAKKRPYIEKVCKVCGKSFQVRPCRAKTAKYCSIKCRAIGMRGRKQSWVDKRIKSVIKGLKRRPTKPEKAFMQIVEKHNLPYRYNGNRGHLIIGGRVPDFYNIHSKEVIEILGRAFHDPNHPSPFPKRTPEQLVHHYAKFGFKCITLWEDEVYNENEVLERISK